MRSLIFWVCAICWLAFSVVAGGWGEKLTGLDKGVVITLVFVVGGFFLMGLIGYLRHLLVQMIAKQIRKGS